MQQDTSETAQNWLSSRDTIHAKQIAFLTLEKIIIIHSSWKDRQLYGVPLLLAPLPCHQTHCVNWETVAGAWASQCKGSLSRFFSALAAETHVHAMLAGYWHAGRHTIMANNCTRLWLSRIIAILYMYWGAYWLASWDFYYGGIMFAMLKQTKIWFNSLYRWSYATYHGLVPITTTLQIHTKQHKSQPVCIVQCWTHSPLNQWPFAPLRRNLAWLKPSWSRR